MQMCTCTMIHKYSAESVCWPGPLRPAHATNLVHIWNTVHKYKCIHINKITHMYLSSQKNMQTTSSLHSQDADQYDQLDHQRLPPGPGIHIWHTDVLKNRCMQIQMNTHIYTKLQETLQNQGADQKWPLRPAQATLLARMPQAIWPAAECSAGHPGHLQNPRQEHLEESSAAQTCNILIPNTSCNLVHDEWSGNPLPKVRR